MTNFPDGMTRYDWQHVEGRHLRDNEHLSRPSTTTGTYGESSEFVRWVATQTRANTPKHRTSVLAQNEFRFANYCIACGWVLTPRGASKAELEALAREHEANQ